MHQSSSSFLSFDVIDLIIESIDDPRDLFQLSLTSKTLYRFITSNDLYFRWMRCSWNQPKVWSLLEQDARIASRVRLLELVGDLEYPRYGVSKYMPPLPLSLTVVNNSATQDDEVIVARFKDALINMINLTKFSWMIPEIPDIPGDDILNLCLDLALCHKNVRELDMGPFEVILLLNPTSCRSRSPKTSMSHLTRICIIFNTINYPEGAEIKPDAPSVKRLVETVVDHCPNLEVLSLKSDLKLRMNYPAFRIFAEGRWPNLRRLALFGGIIYLPGGSTDPEVRSAILNAFWKRHPNLECLLLRINQEHKLDIQSDILPKLKSLSGFLNPAVSAVAVDVLPRIKHMCDYTTDLQTPRFPISYFKHTTSLTSLILMELDDDWEQLLSNHPTITRFALYRKLMSKDLSIDDEYQRGLSRLNALASLPSLTHLYFLSNLYFREPFEYMSYLSRFPKLKYIAGLRSHYEWNVLERDDEGRVTGWHPPEKALIASLESFEEWGCDLRATEVLLEY